MKIYIIRTVSLILSVLTAVMIYSFSADTAKESSDLSGNITEVVLEATGHDKETTPPAEYEKLKAKTEFSIRKLAHFSEYAIFGLFLCTFFMTFKKLCEKRFPALLLALAVAVPYAAFDEWHQAFVPGRGPGVTDVLIDSAGSLCGSLVVLAVYAVLLYLEKKKKTTVTKRDPN